MKPLGTRCTYPIPEHLLCINLSQTVWPGLTP